MWEGGGGCPPSHSESFLHFDVVNGAIWCICPVFSSYSTNLYLILLWKWLKGGSFTCIHATLFSFFLSLSPSLFFFCILGGGATAPTAPPPPGYAPACNIAQSVGQNKTQTRQASFPHRNRFHCIQLQFNQVSQNSHPIFFFCLLCSPCIKVVAKTMNC